MSGHRYDRYGERIDHDDDETLVGRFDRSNPKNARDVRPREGTRPSSVPSGAVVTADRVRPVGEVVAPVKPHDCDDGWLGEDDVGRIVPCLLCRPHLARREHRP